MDAFMRGVPGSNPLQKESIPVIRASKCIKMCPKSMEIPTNAYLATSIDVPICTTVHWLSRVLKSKSSSSLTVE